MSEKLLKEIEKLKKDIASCELNIQTTRNQQIFGHGMRSSISINASMSMYQYALEDLQKQLKAKEKLLNKTPQN